MERLFVFDWRSRRAGFPIAEQGEQEREVNSAGRHLLLPCPVKRELYSNRDQSRANLGGSENSHNKSMKPGEDQNHNQPNRATSGRPPWFPSKKLQSSPSLSDSSSSTRRASSDSQLAIHIHPSPLPQQEEILTRLKSMSVDKLRRLLDNREAYNSFLLSLEPVKNQINIYGELQTEVLNLARENSAKDSLVKELNDKCEAIRSTEIAEMETKLAELEKQMAEIVEKCSSSSMLLKLQNAMREGDEESESLKKKLLENEIGISEFLDHYREKRALYHRRNLLNLAAKICGV